MKATDETKQAAKEAGIKSWHVKSEEKLQKELAELTETVNTGESNEQPGLEESVSEDSGSDSEVLQELPEEAKIIRFSIKCLGTKSPYYKYKDLV